MDWFDLVGLVVCTDWVIGGFSAEWVVSGRLYVIQTLVNIS